METHLTAVLLLLCLQ